jgi:PAS domain S-box-containing protein
MTTKPPQPNSSNQTGQFHSTPSSGVSLADDIIIGVSLDGYITHWNEAAADQYGFTEDQMVGASYTRLIPADRHEEHQRILDLLSSSQGAHVDQTIRVRSDGQHFTVEVRAAPVFDKTRNPTGGVITETDITARLRSEADIRRVNELLTQLNARLSQAFKDNESFSYSVSHDLREPLRAINGFSQALDEDYRDQLDDEGRHYLDRIRIAGDRMARLIDDILRLSRLSRQDLVLRDIDLAQVARGIFRDLQTEEPDRQIELIITDTMAAHADRRLISIALENLIRNSWKYTTHSASPRIELGVKQDQGQTVYYITDNGCGFAPELADEIFLPFRRSKRAEQFSGTGIGLAIVKRIVERHQGTIWCESQPNQGATFYFTLNLRE